MTTTHFGNHTFMYWQSVFQVTMSHSERPISKTIPSAIIRSRIKSNPKTFGITFKSWLSMKGVTDYRRRSLTSFSLFYSLTFLTLYLIVLSFGVIHTNTVTNTSEKTKVSYHSDRSWRFSVVPVWSEGSNGFSFRTIHQGVNYKQWKTTIRIC